MGKFFLLTVLAAMALAGCVYPQYAYSPFTAPEEVPAAGQAYVYGMFYIDSLPSVFARDSYASMGFEFVCNDGKDTFTARFDRAAPLRVIRITPGLCHLKRTVFTNANGSLVDDSIVNGEFPGIEFRAGSVYYLGDFTAAYYCETRMAHWGLTRARDNYTETTRQFRLSYGLLHDWPSQDQSLVHGDHYYSYGIKKPPGVGNGCGLGV